MEEPGIDPGTSRMLSERSTTWATPPDTLYVCVKFDNYNVVCQPHFQLPLPLQIDLHEEFFPVICQMVKRE